MLPLFVDILYLISLYLINKVMKAYTYLIKHKPSGKVYYGYRGANTVTPEKDLWIKYFTSSKYIQTLVEQDGADAFDYEIRRKFDTQEQAIDWETKVLRRMRVLEQDNWLNKNIAGYIIPTEESRKKISEYHKDKPKSKEHKRKLSEVQKGTERPWAIKNLPTDTSGENNGMFNKKHTEESKRKMSESSKGKPAWNKGIPISEEQRAKQSAKMKGRKMDPKVVAKRAAAQRGKKRPTLTCPHCDKTVAVNTYARWHGANCRSNGV